MVLFQLLINGFIAGALYALVACGFTLIYSTNKFMHFAHGSSVVVGGYLLYSFFTLLGLPFYLACASTILLTAVFGWGLYYAIYQPLQERHSSNIILLIASIGLLILFQNIIQVIFGPSVKSIGYIPISKGITLFGAIITKLQIALIALALLLSLVLYLFMQRTMLGRTMRAVSDNQQLANIIGINAQRVKAYSFLLGSGLAGLAGILIGLEQNLVPTMGTELMIKGFTGAVVGGITSVPGAIAGSFIVGIVENLGIWFLPSGYKNGITFLLLFIFLLWKPTGLFGLNKGIKNV
ncbi:branched-chain amino acid ABC transporter permease [Candidatus Woesearchaeota archaeon]|nr:branched-chain amino acid ABC transporter permease [Candidatus Woesearchaeota archaeon]